MSEPKNHLVGNIMELLQEMKKIESKLIMTPCTHGEIMTLQAKQQKLGLCFEWLKNIQLAQQPQAQAAPANNEPRGNSNNFNDNPAATQQPGKIITL